MTKPPRSTDPAGSNARKRYEPPRIAATGEFETLAFGCAMAVANPRDPGNPCNSGKITTY